MSRSVLVSPERNVGFVAPVITSKREQPTLIAEGTRYGFLVATPEFDLRVRRDGRNRCYQKFVCDCGNALFLVGYSVKSGNTQSCGCIHSAGISKQMITHGLSKTRAYRNELAVRVRGVRRARLANAETEPITSRDLSNIALLFNNACWICEEEPTKIHWDHVHPIAKGGAHLKKNLRPACRDCNSRKNDTWPFTEEMRIKIANVVRALRTPQAHTMPAPDGSEVNCACHS